MAIFTVTLRHRAQIFVKKATIYENVMIQFVFTFSTRNKCEEWRNVAWKDIYFVWRLLQCKLNKLKINYLEEWLGKYVCWQLIYTLP